MILWNKNHVLYRSNKEKKVVTVGHLHTSGINRPISRTEIHRYIYIYISDSVISQCGRYFDRQLLRLLMCYSLTANKLNEIRVVRDHDDGDGLGL